MTKRHEAFTKIHNSKKSSYTQIVSSLDNLNEDQLISKLCEIVLSVTGSSFDIKMTDGRCKAIKSLNAVRKTQASIQKSLINDDVEHKKELNYCIIAIRGIHLLQTKSHMADCNDMQISVNTTNSELNATSNRFHRNVGMLMKFQNDLIAILHSIAVTRMNSEVISKVCKNLISRISRLENEHLRRLC